MFQYKKELLKFCYKVYEKEYVAATDGNLSLRLPDGNILITPSGKNKGELKIEDFIVVTPSGDKVYGNGKCSSEVKIHLLIYKKRNDINAVVHCHPTYATVLSITENKFEYPVLPEVVLTLGKVLLCKYGTPSTDELPDSMEPYVNKGDAFLLQNHGAVTCGKNIEDAYFKMEKLEHAARILYLAGDVDKMRLLTSEELKKLYFAAENTYGLSVAAENRYRT